MRNIWGFYHYKFLRCSNKYFFHILQTSKLHQKFQKFMNKAIKKEKNWKTPKLYNVSSSNKKHSRNSSVIRQKGESHESQNGCFMKTKHTKFSEKRTFLTPWYAHVRVKYTRTKCLFYGKFGVLRFLETPVLRFALLLYYRRIFKDFHMKLFSKSASEEYIRLFLNVPLITTSNVKTNSSKSMSG